MKFCVIYQQTSHNAQSPVRIVEQAPGRVYHADGVVAAAQRRDDLRGAGESHGALRRRAAGQDGDPHQRMPAS